MSNIFSSFFYSPPATPYQLVMLALPPAMKVLSEWISPFAQAVAKGLLLNPAGILDNQPPGRFEYLGEIYVFVQINPFPDEYVLTSVSDTQLSELHSWYEKCNGLSLLRDLLRFCDTSIYTALFIPKTCWLKCCDLSLLLSRKANGWVGTSQSMLPQAQLINITVTFYCGVEPVGSFWNVVPLSRIPKLPEHQHLCTHRDVWHLFSVSWSSWILSQSVHLSQNVSTSVFCVQW